MGCARVGSNPAAVVFFIFSFRARHSGRDPGGVSAATKMNEPAANDAAQKDTTAERFELPRATPN